jgi:uncharacterized protein (TIGR02231 family)
MKLSKLKAMHIKSKISQVTIYNDRALVERIAKIKLPQGEQTIVFEGLPFLLDINSLQVGGGIQSILLEIKPREVNLQEIPEGQKKELSEDIEKLEIQINEQTDILTNLEKEKSLLHRLTEMASESPKKGSSSLQDPQKINDMLAFYSSKMNEIDGLIRQNKRLLAKLEAQITSMREKFDAYHNESYKKERVVEVKIVTQEECEQVFVLSYLVANARWKPVYDFRLNSETKKLSIAYNAIISQKTGEKWDDVKLCLSTARPQISAIQPLLNTWFIDVDKPIPIDYKMEKAKSPMSYMAAGTLGGADLNLEVEEFDETPMPVSNAKVETGATAVTFVIPGTHSINDNNEEHKIGITALEFDAKLEYNAVPKLSTFAYLTAISSNASEYPMLAGKSNIFLDNSFVAHSAIKFVSPNQEFKTSLGVDEAIRIEHKLVNILYKDEGLFSKKSKIIYDYNIKIENTKKIDCSIIIQDQIPISRNQDIRVELLEPKYKEDTPDIKKTDKGFIEWKYTIKPNEKIQLSLKFSIEYPREIDVAGL